MRPQPLSAARGAGVVGVLALCCLGLLGLNPGGLRFELVAKAGCDDVYQSWRGFDTNNPECLHGYLMDKVQPTADCLRDPMLCASNHLQATEERGNSWQLTKAFPRGLRKRGEDMYPHSVPGPYQEAEGQYPTAFAMKGARQQMLAEQEAQSGFGKQAQRGRSSKSANKAKTPLWTVHKDPVTGRSYRYDENSGRSAWIKNPVEKGNFPDLPKSLKGITKAPEVTSKYSPQLAGLSHAQPLPGHTQVQSIASLATEHPGQSVDITQDMMQVTMDTAQPSKACPTCLPFVLWPCLRDPPPTQLKAFPSFYPPFSQALEDCRTQSKGNCKKIMGVLGGQRFKDEEKKQAAQAEKVRDEEWKREAQLKKEGYVFSTDSVHPAHRRELVTRSISGKALESEEAKNEEQSEGWENDMIYGARDSKVPPREGVAQTRHDAQRRSSKGEVANLSAVAAQVAVLQKEAADRSLRDGRGSAVTKIETGASQAVKRRLREVNKKLQGLAKAALDQKHQLSPAREQQFKDAASAMAAFSS